MADGNVTGQRREAHDVREGYVQMAVHNNYCVRFDVCILLFRTPSFGEFTPIRLADGLSQAPEQWQVAAEYI